jgi:hypothetical protein
VNDKRDHRAGSTDTIWDRYEEAFLDGIGSCVERSSYAEYSGCRQTGETRISGRSRIYEGEKLDRVIVNRYTVKGDRCGLVIFGYPRVEYDIPSFLLHMGGMPPTKTLAIMDLAPASASTNMAPFREVASAHRAALDLPDTRVEWLRSVTSPHLLHCAFKPLDVERFLGTLEATVHIWRTAYIEPATRDADEASVKARSEAVLSMKEVLYKNDPGFRIFTKAFGQAMADVLAEAGFGGNPGLNLTEVAEPAPTPGSWYNKKLGVGWNADAQERVLEAPLFLRRMIRRTIEKEAVKDGAEVVTVALVDRCEQKYRRGKQA